MNDVAIRIENLKKKYKLGAIGGQTLNAELQSWWARKRGKEDPNLELGQENVRFGESFYALKGINLEIKKGEAVGIIGGNGAGKSTLLKILSRVTAPTEGDVWINGRISSMLEVGTGFHGELTGRENIYMNGAILGMSRREVDEKIESIIDFSECRQFIDTPVKRYSSGMYVKLAFAVASHLDSEIMIMDEVLAVGDMAFQKKCLGKMGDEAKGGKAVLYVSHNMATIRSLCDRCIVLQKGEVIFDGDVEKAISLYLHDKDNVLISKYDLRNSDRAVRGLGKEMHLEYVYFTKDVPVYNCSEKMQLVVEYVKEKTFDDASLFLHLFDAHTGNPVSLIISNKFCTAGGKNVFDTDISGLAEGVYYFEIGVMRLLPDGTHITLDRVNKRILFQVMREYSVGMPLWKNSIYGNMVFPKMQEIGV